MNYAVPKVIKIIAGISFLLFSNELSAQEDCDSIYIVLEKTRDELKKVKEDNLNTHKLLDKAENENKTIKTKLGEIEKENWRLQQQDSLLQLMLTIYEGLLNEKDKLLDQKDTVINNQQIDIRIKQQNIESLNNEIKIKNTEIAEVKTNLNNAKDELTIIRSLKIYGIDKKTDDPILLTSDHPIRRRKINRIKVEFITNNSTIKAYPYTLMRKSKNGDYTEVPKDDIKNETGDFRVYASITKVDRNIRRTILKRGKYQFELSGINFAKNFILK